jgi:hypothetical protein
MIFSENRYPLFGIMLWNAEALSAVICGAAQAGCERRFPAP